MTFKQYTLSGLSALTLAACQTTAPAPTSAPEMSVAEVHDATLTLDTHIDIPLTYMSEIDPGLATDLQVDLPKLVSGKLDSGVWIIYTPQGELTAED